jgi:hypothetical protein
MKMFRRLKLRRAAEPVPAWRKLENVANKFYAAAPYQNDTAGWRFLPYKGRSLWLMVSLETGSPSFPSVCFVRVMTMGVGPNLDHTPVLEGRDFEFYARAFADGTIIYRSEAKGELFSEVQEFVKIMGIQSHTFPEELPLSSDQAAILGDYLMRHKGGQRLSSDHA